VHDHNLHGWYVYAGDHPVSGRWGIHLEAQWRRHDVIVRPQQLLLRPGVNFRVNDRIALSAGYAYVTTHRYGDYPAAAPFPEHRLHQQATVRHGPASFEMQHRFRLEQRWIGQPGLPERWRYQNRFRYMARAQVPIRGPWYLAVQDELFLNVRPLQGARVFDQNRAFAGIGRRLRWSTRVEFGYMQQTLLQRNGQVLEFNHTLHLGVYSALPFRKK
jgi:hypothetical protein